jgi:hypothetical protein
MFGGELCTMVSPKITTVPGGPFGQYRAAFGEQSRHPRRDGVDLVAGKNTWERDHTGTVEDGKLIGSKDHEARLATSGTRSAR